MQTQKFVVDNVRDAIQRVKKSMGPNAVIESIRSIKDQAGQTALEVVASLDGPRLATLTPSPPETAPPELAPSRLVEVLSELQGITRRLDDIHRELKPEWIADRLDGFAEGLGNLQQMVIDSNGGSRRDTLHFDPELAPYYERLIAEGVDAAYAQDLIERASRALSSRSLSPSIYGLEYLADALVSQVRTATPFAPGRKQHIHMLVGPTGVGKTTTVAKLAAQQVFEQGRKVALLTVDTFRIGAIEQLRTYAKILDVPLEICMNEVDLVECARRHADKDTIFIDTAGASQKDARMMGELAKYYETGVPMDVHLIVGATTSDADLADVADRYSVFPLTSLIVSKLDEANNFGSVYNLMRQTNLPCSYFTVGQNVPDDIEIATPERVADLLLDVTGQA
jgi:flagellar biosynthetic protein FlhF